MNTTRYNQYMLAKKGQAYLIRKKAVEELQERLKIQEQKKRETEELLSGKNKRLTELEEQKQLAETEKAGLMDADLEEVDQKLERAKVQWTEAKKNEQRWEEKIQDCKDRLREQERQLEVCRDRLEERLREIGEEKGELEEQQEILQWEKHQTALQIISAEEKERTSELTKDLLAWKRQLEECRKTIQGYEEICKQYDEISSLLEVLRKQEAEEEQRLEAAREQITDCMDEWIEAVYGAAKEAKEWHPEKTVLQRVEEKIREYQNSTDAGSIQEILRKDYEQQRQVLVDLRTRLEYEQKLLEDREKETKEQLRKYGIRRSWSRSVMQMQWKRENCWRRQEFVHCRFIKRWNSPINWMRQHVQGWKLSCRKWEFWMHWSYRKRISQQSERFILSFWTRFYMWRTGVPQDFQL